jgi:CheY-like chemotaxis protein
MIPASKKIILIDDDEISSYITAELIRKSQANIILKTFMRVRDTQLFLNTCEESDFPDMIICDIKMPERDGFDFLHFYQNTIFPKRLPIPLIMMSGTINDQEKLMLEQYSCCTSFIMKKDLQDNFLQYFKVYFPAE